MSACLDEETILGFAGAALAPDALLRVEEHIDGFAVCRRVIAETVRGAPRS